MQVPITSVSGYNYQYQNFGQTSNKGFEFAVNYNAIEKKNFTLTVNANISYNRNHIDKLNTTSEYQNYKWAGSTFNDGENFKVVEGGRLGEVYGYKYNGFYTAYDETTNPMVNLSGMVSSGHCVMALRTTAIRPSAVN